jgi:hypothetical protein
MTAFISLRFSSCRCLSRIRRKSWLLSETGVKDLAVKEVVRSEVDDGVGVVCKDCDDEPEDVRADELPCELD